MQDTNLERVSTKRSITFFSWMILRFMRIAKKRLKRLTSAVRIFSKVITIDWGISKCAHVTIKEGKLVSFGGMEYLFGEVIPELESGKGCKYLGILEANDIMHFEIKGNIQKEYYSRVRQLTSSKLNGGIQSMQ